MFKEREEVMYYYSNYSSCYTVYRDVCCCDFAHLLFVLEPGGPARIEFTEPFGICGVL